MSKSKPLTREQYLKKFSRSARWRLPPQESEEAIADYQELIFQEERDETKLVEELGEPVQAAHLLTDVKSYRRWLWVFAVLAFGLFLLGKWCFMGWSWAYRFLWWEQEWFPVLVMAVGLPLSLVWFRRHGQKNGALTKQLLLALAVVLVAGCGNLCWIWHVMELVIHKALPDGAWGYHSQVWMMVTAMMYTGVCSALLGLIGLVQAKCRDRRWLAVYILCVTVVAMLAFVTFNLKSMDVSANETAEVFRVYLFSRMSAIGAVGLIGTGVALC